jgi:hypothetical protein
MATGTGQLDQIIATTFEKVRPVLADNITTQNALLAALDSKSKVTEDGGRVIRKPVLFDFNDTVGSYDGYDPIDTTPQGGLGFAEYEWKQYAGSVTISGKEERLNSGAPQIIALLQAKLEQLRVSTEQDMNAMLWGDGTGNGGKDFLGVVAIVADSGILGGIDPTSETFWKSLKVSTADITSVSGVKKLNSVLNSLRIVKSKPDFEFTEQASFEAYEALATPNIRFEDLKMADLGFDVVAHKGAEVMFEPEVPSGKWYFINSQYMEFTRHADAWLKMLDFVRPVNQDAKSALVVSMGNLVTDVRRAHGYINSVTNS